MRKLHEINSDLMSVLEGYQDTTEGESLPDIHSLEMEAVDKVKQCLHVCNRLQSEIIEAQTVIDNAQAYINSRKNAVTRIEGDVMLTMEISGLTKIDDPDMKVIIPKASEKPFIKDEKLIVDEYMRTIPATLKPDMKLIKEALKAGKAIEGVIMVPTKVSLRYKKPKAA